MKRSLSMRHAADLRQTLFALLGLAGCAAARPESTTSGSGDSKPPVEAATSTSTGGSLVVLTADPPPGDPDPRPPPIMEARKSRTCSVAVSAANGAKALQCREVLAQTPKSSLRACTDNAACDRGEQCLPDENGKNACVHLAGQTLDCASDLDCTEGTRCVLDAGSLTHGTCTYDGCGATCGAGTVCAPVASHDSSMDDDGFGPGGPAPNQGFAPAGLRCMPAAASTFEDQSPPQGMCRVSIHTSCVIAPGGDWQCTTSGGLGRHPCGRPLLVDGEPHTALAARGSASSRALVTRLRAIAFDEHASIVAFARVLTQLAALGAPLALLQKTSAALADEVEHARLAFELLDDLDPSARGQRPGAFPAALASLQPGGGDVAALRRALLVDTIVGGAIGESGSVLDAVELKDGAPDGVRGFLDRVIADETRHAALAFETIAWLTSEDPSLRGVVAETLARAPAAPVVDRVVRPVLSALLS